MNGARQRNFRPRGRSGLTALGLILVTGLVVSACSPPTTGGDGSSDTPEPEGEQQEEKPNGYDDLYAQLEGLDAEARTAKLIEIGNEEGGMSLYTSNTQMQEMVDQFEDYYGEQGLSSRVAIYRAPSNTVLQRILQEDAAGFQGADLIIEGHAPQMAALSEETDILAPFKSPILEDRRDGLDYPLWSITRFTAHSVVWNANEIQGDDVPASYADLTDPKYNGRMMMEPRSFDWFLTLWKHFESEGMSESEIEEYFDTLAEYSSAVEGQPLQIQFLTTGEVPLGAGTYTQLAFRAANEGAPVEYKPIIEPVVLSPSGAGLIKTAKSPAMAVLFMEYIMTIGQELLAEQGRVPPSDLEESGLLAGADYIITDPLELIGENGEEWRQKYADLLEGRTVIKE